MRTARRLVGFVLVSFSLTGAPTALQAQSAKAVAASARVRSAVESSQRVRLAGHVPPWAVASEDLGAVSPDLKLDNLHLVLSRSPEVEAAFDQLLADQQNPASPRYHQWLTPQQNADQYGVAPSDLAAVKSWLQSQGLSVDDVAAGGVFITFSGPTSAVENAFSTKLHLYNHANLKLRAPTVEPAVPTAIASVIAAVGGLDDLRLHSYNRHEPAPTALDAAAGSAQPFYTSTSTGNHYLAPADWNTIYDNTSVLSSGINGNTSRVLILDYGRVAAADISYFQTYFGLPTTAQPNTILLAGSTDPGYDGINGWQAEGTLDVERVMSVAPGAGIDYFIAGTSSYSNTFSQLQYNISTLNDPVVSMSFGSCEANGSSTAATFDSYFKTGAAQGIGNYVSSGDTGAAGCDTNGSAAPASPKPIAANVVCVSGYATCVGGTEFAEGSGSYWTSTNNSTTKASVLGYIPEGAWNEPSSTSSAGVTSYAPASSGGGVSFNIAKPSWQVGVGVPADGKRDTPDMSFTAAGSHDGYLIYVTNALYVFGGTSAAAPSMAGVAALYNQKKGSAQGNLNPTLYSLAATPANNIFHDITVATSGVTNCVVTTPSMCNNSAPAPAALTGGEAGYLLTTGYDLVTGLGSIDVQNFINSAVAAPGIKVTPASNALSFTSGAVTGNTEAFTVTSLNGFTGSVSLTCVVSQGTVTDQPTCAISPSATTLLAGGSVSGVVTITTATAHAQTMPPAFGNGMKTTGAVLALMVCLLPFRRRKAIRPLLAIAALFGGFTMISGCGGGGTAAVPVTTTTTTTPTLKSSAGSYVVIINAASTGASGTVFNAGSFNLTVN